jgi:hypothetical protein
MDAKDPTALQSDERNGEEVVELMSKSLGRAHFQIRIVKEFRDESRSISWAKSAPFD